MASDIALFIIVLIAMAITAWLFFSVIEFIVEVPKQLKRIADALERRPDNGKIH